MWLREKATRIPGRRRGSPSVAGIRRGAPVVCPWFGRADCPTTTASPAVAAGSRPPRRGPAEEEPLIELDPLPGAC
jgi:hypothetical protein